MLQPSENTHEDATFEDFSDLEDEIETVTVEFNKFQKEQKTESNRPMIPQNTHPQGTSSQYTTPHLDNAHQRTDENSIHAHGETETAGDTRLNVSAPPFRPNDLTLPTYNTSRPSISTPKVELTAFGGELLKCNTWIGLYKTLVHDTSKNNLLYMQPPSVPVFTTDNLAQRQLTDSQGNINEVEHVCTTVLYKEEHDHTFFAQQQPSAAT